MQNNMNADNLPKAETRGYKMAMSWLELDIRPYFVRHAVSSAMVAHTPGGLRAYSEQAPEQWRENAKGAHDSRYAYVCATMAGCERAIEEWEARE